MTALVNSTPLNIPATSRAFVSTSSSIWHQRLGHPRSSVLRVLAFNNLIFCNKGVSSVSCQTCQLSKHTCLPFSTSESIVSSCFDIVHSDVWTSPIFSISGIKYYVLFLDLFLISCGFTRYERNLMCSLNYCIFVLIY